MALNTAVVAQEFRTLQLDSCGFYVMKAVYRTPGTEAFMHDC